MTDPKDLVLNVLLLTREEEKKNENIEFNPTHKWRIILVMSWVNRPEDNSLILWFLRISFYSNRRKDSDKNKDPLHRDCVSTFYSQSQ